MLQIPSMTSDDLLFYFTDGLQTWAKQELQSRDVKDVDEAIVVAESLTEFQRGEASRPKPNPKPHNFAKGGGDKGPKEFKRDPNKASSKREAYEEKKKAFVPKGGCFVCKGPHPMKDCPKLGSLSAMVEQQEKMDQASQSGHIGSIRLFNAIEAKPVPKQQGSKGLMYVEALVNGKKAQAMVDTGATHNFITLEEAKRVGLQSLMGVGGSKP